MPTQADYQAWNAAAGRLALKRNATVADLSAGMLNDAMNRVNGTYIKAVNEAQAIGAEMSAAAGGTKAGLTDPQAFLRELDKKKLSKEKEAKVEALAAKLAKPNRVFLKLTPAITEFSMWAATNARPTAIPSGEAVLEVAEGDPVEVTFGAGKMKTVSKYSKTAEGIVIETNRIEANGSKTPMGAFLYPADAPLGAAFAKLFAYAKKEWQKELAAPAVGEVTAA